MSLADVPDCSVQDLDEVIPLGPAGVRHAVMENGMTCACLSGFRACISSECLVRRSMALCLHVITIDSRLKLLIRFVHALLPSVELDTGASGCLASTTHKRSQGNYQCALTACTTCMRQSADSLRMRSPPRSVPVHPTAFGCCMPCP